MERRSSSFFAEAGVGFTLTPRICETEGKRFSAVFKLGHHLAIGHSFGTIAQHAVTPRREHFSNGGIRENQSVPVRPSSGALPRCCTVVRGSRQIGVATEVLGSRNFFRSPAAIRA